MAPSSVAFRLDRAPWNFPMGVRHPATTTAVSTTLRSTKRGRKKAVEKEGRCRWWGGRRSGKRPT